MSTKQPTTKRLAMWGLGLVGLLALLSVTAAWFLTRTDHETLVEEYNALADDFSQRTYPRAEAPPQGKLEEGAAADTYRKAYEAFIETDGDEAEIKDKLQDFQAALWPDKDKEDRKDQPANPTQPTDPDCLKLGVVPDKGDAATATLDAASCAKLLGSLDAVELALDATRFRNARSPIHIYDPWSADKPGHYRSILPFINLGKTVLLVAHLKGLSGDTKTQIQMTAAVMRIGRDIASGSGLLGTMVGVAIDKTARQYVEAIILRPDLGVEDAQRVLDEITYAARHPFSSKEAFEGEYLTMTPAMVPPKIKLNAPPTAMEAFAPTGIVDRILLGDYIKIHQEMWMEILPTFEQTYPARRKAIDAILGKHTNKINPLAQIATPNLGRYDREITLANLRTQMLTLLAAARLHHLRHDKPPTSLKDLEAILGEPIEADPFTGDQPTLSNNQGRIILKAGVFEAGHEVLDGEDDSEGLNLEMPVSIPAQPPL